MKSFKHFFFSFSLILFVSHQALANTPIADSSQLTDVPAYLNNATISIAEQNYLKLHDILPIYQEAALHPWPIISSSRLLKQGMHSSIVPLIRVRLSATNELADYDEHTNNVYDEHLVEAVKTFQEHNGLNPDGIIGKATLEAFNIPPEVRVKQIEVNMQRWAALAPHLSNRFIMVNIPDYRLRVFEGNQEVLTMKAIVGKPTTQTPEIQSQVKRIVFNPAWNVPVKIAQKELVKKVIEDPGYLDTNHIKIYESPEHNAGEVSQYDVDWQSAEVNGFPYHFRQDPGDDNSLGLVKFEFANSADVYLHDTPIKELFDKDARAFSHGCVRLENAFALVDYLMLDDPKWNEENMQEILAIGKTKYVKASHPTPIFITYITAWVGDDGTVNFRDDIYQKDLEPLT